MNYCNRVDVKIVILGDLSVGKTSLLRRFIEDRFENKTCPTIGGAFASKLVEVNGVNRVFGLWDTAGSERYRAMTKSFYRGAGAAIICFDLTNRDSWVGMKSWISELREVEGDCKLYICGTKKDLIDDEILERGVSVQMCREYSAGLLIPMFETSSKTGENVKELFDTILNNCNFNEENKNGKINGIIKLDEKKRRIRCCQMS